MDTNSSHEGRSADEISDPGPPPENARRLTPLLEEAIDRARQLVSHYDEQRVVVRIGPATWADAWSAAIGVLHPQPHLAHTEPTDAGALNARLEDSAPNIARRTSPRADARRRTRSTTSRPSKR
jgi:hypothetical protein